MNSKFKIVLWLCWVTLSGLGGFAAARAWKSWNNNAVASYSSLPDSKPDSLEMQLPAKIIEVHDGDTVTVEFKIEARIRLIDCWAPELKTKEGDAAKEFLGKLLKPESDVYIKIPFNGQVQKSLSLNRVLGKVYRDIDADGVSDNLSEVMVKWGMATETKPKPPKMGL